MVYRAGKTALLSQFAYKQFKENYKATIGSDFTTRDIGIDGTIATLQIWDTAGQERFRSLSTAFFRGTDVCILVYDVTEPKSLDSLALWKSDFVDQVGLDEHEEFAFVVIGNKVDLDTQRQVTKAKGEQVAREIGAVAHFETSAKTGHNVEKAFHAAASTALKRSAQRKPYMVYVCAFALAMFCPFIASFPPQTLETVHTDGLTNFLTRRPTTTTPIRPNISGDSLLKKGSNNDHGGSCC